jgi:hypothetical protein
VENKDTSLGNVPRERKKEEVKHIVEAQKHVEAEETKGGRNLMMRKILLKPEKESEEPVQRTSLFRTTLQGERQSLQGDHRQWEH